MNGDHLLSPAYDLLNARLHVADANFALHGGLLDNELRSSGYRKTGNLRYSDFVVFGKEIGVKEARIDKLLLPFSKRQKPVAALIGVIT